MGSQAPHGSDRRFLRDESQSSHGVWGNLDLLHFFLHCRCVGVGKGWDRYRLGHPAVEVLAHAPPLNVQSRHSKVLHQGSSCAAMGPGCTGHVQPLDVGCFSPLKAFLGREARDVLARKASFTKLDWLLTVNKAATEFLRGKRWAPIFHQCGVIGDRTGLKGFLSTNGCQIQRS